MMTPFDLSLRHLEAVTAIAQEGSISAASLRINLSQPAITQALLRLEARLGHRLFDRQASGATPTNPGRLLVDRAERALDHLATGIRRLRRAARKQPLAHPERAVTSGQLRALVAVARAGSYAMAARQIGISQPAVHRAVRELQMIVAEPLVFRHGRSIQPTPRGAALIRAVRLMAAELQAGLDELTAITAAGAGRLVVGALPLPRAGILPEALAAFMRARPHARATVVEGHYRELLADLRAGDIDLMIGALRSPPPTADVVQIPLFADDLYVVARAGHPLAGAIAADRTALAGYPWIVGAADAPMRVIWEGMFDAAMPPLHLECSSTLTARGLLLEGDWIALMSPDQFRIEARAGLLRPIGGAIPGSRRQIGLTVRAGWRPTAAQAIFLELLHEASARR